jgi:DNA-binding XRE family transcriptional regulator
MIHLQDITNAGKKKGRTTKRRKGQRRRRGPKGPANRIADLRIAAGFATQTAAAHKAGVSTSLWQVWESGKTLEGRTVATIRLIAWTIDVTIAELVDP